MTPNPQYTRFNSVTDRFANSAQKIQDNPAGKDMIEEKIDMLLSENNKLNDMLKDKINDIIKLQSGLKQAEERSQKWEQLYRQKEAETE